jgi:hypothetical protein
MKQIECLTWASKEISTIFSAKPRAKRDRPSCLVQLGQERFRELPPLMSPKIPCTLKLVKMTTKILLKEELQQTQISPKKFKSSAISEVNFQL